MLHHNLQEEDLKNQCLYCKESFSDKATWESRFEGEIHYKSLRCLKCGKDHMITVDFFGSGHDKWADSSGWKNKIKNTTEKIEDKIIKELLAADSNKSDSKKN